MSDAYIEQHDGVCVVAGTRVSLDSIVYAFLSGQSAEAIAQAFPVMNLEQVYCDRCAVDDRRAVGELLRMRLDFPLRAGTGLERLPAIQSLRAEHGTSAHRHLQPAANEANRRSQRCRAALARRAQHGRPCFRANSSRNSSAGFARPASTSSKPCWTAWTV